MPYRCGCFIRRSATSIDPRRTVDAAVTTEKLGGRCLAGLPTGTRPGVVVTGLTAGYHENMAPFHPAVTSSTKSLQTEVGQSDIICLLNLESRVVCL